MIKVNLLYNRAVVSADAKVSGTESVVSASEFQLDDGFSTFEYSQTAQVIKILLLIAFVAPLLVFEKMRGDQDQITIAEKRKDVQNLQDLKFTKEEELQSYEGLEAKREVLTIRDNEFRAVKSDRLMAVQSTDALQSAVPEGVWLLGIEYSKGSMKLTGQTLLENGLDSFVQKIEATRGFSNINIPKDVKIKSPSGRTINEFLVTLTVEDSLLEPEGEL
jgi:Tfp pilus assembly protein PilN